jgi:hypothetical protein
MANRYFISGAGGSPYNTNTTANWATTSGGAGGASIPGTSDTAIFDANSPNAVVNAAITLYNFDATNYTNTITMNDDISVTGDALTVTFGSGMAFNSGLSGKFIFDGSLIYETEHYYTFNSNNIYFPCELQMIVNSYGVMITTLLNNINCHKYYTMNTSSNVYFDNSSNYKLITQNIEATVTTIDIELVGVTGEMKNLTTYNSLPKKLLINYSDSLTMTGIHTLSNINLQLSAGTIINNFSSLIILNANSEISVLNSTLPNLSILNNLKIVGGRIDRLSVASHTLTINNSKLISDYISIINPTFLGTHGFDTNQLVKSATTTGSITFQSGLTYNIYDNIYINPTITPTTTLKSSKSKVKSYLNLINSSATYVMDNLTINDIDMSGGLAVNTLRSTLSGTTNITNWNTLQEAVEGCVVEEDTKIYTFFY